jgi:hypothetical protein
MDHTDESVTIRAASSPVELAERIGGRHYLYLHDAVQTFLHAVTQLESQQQLGAPLRSTPDKHNLHLPTQLGGSAFPISRARHI